MANVQIFPDPQHLASAAAEQFVEIAEASVQLRGVFTVALSGGTTPQMLFRLLASEPYRGKVDWKNTHIFWGDERCVPPDNEESNYLKAKQTLLDEIKIPETNIHRIMAELPPEQAAEDYEEKLLQYFSSIQDETERTQAQFDLVLLGMGDDGHTASLFPGTPAIHEETRWVAAQYIDKLAAWRITLTPAILNRAAHIIFLVSGAPKAYALQKILYGAYQPDRYPAQIIDPQHGTLLWMIDEPAASM